MTFLIAAIGLLLAASPLWPRPAKEADDDVGLFIGSARPLAAAALVKRPVAVSRSQKRTQLV
jgi:hypothetical protein